ncbi:Aste57867_19506 [Aphanomyces stellatus]|uniref:Aste57867_19506 protein n=1 Tax=Aphanomyces stellatus TaxID=120398 RepID=A0A485LHE7_9STRA|nr:hypothetical protein As57867_019442 [Aphanomyces stellatus]VFT96216.1 Aste57867_19506 [Aphanomyces stellatus]
MKTTSVIGAVLFVMTTVMGADASDSDIAHNAPKVDAKEHQSYQDATPPVEAVDEKEWGRRWGGGVRWGGRWGGGVGRWGGHWGGGHWGGYWGGPWVPRWGCYPTIWGPSCF